MKRIEKECEWHCPRCDSENVEYGWHDFNWSAVFFQWLCKDCWCDFEECYWVEYWETQYYEEDDLDSND